MFWFDSINRLAVALTVILGLGYTQSSSSEVAHNSLVPRIIGGKPVTNDEFNFVARLKFGEESKQTLCTGSLIEDNIILTAAHCFMSKTNGSVDAVFGGTAMFGFSLDSEFKDNTFVIDGVGISAEYGSYPPINDIAMIILKSRVPESIAKPIGVYQGEFVKDMSFYNVGWGQTTNERNSTSRELMGITLNLGNSEKCAANGVGWNPETQICIDGSSGKGPCMGDSGGPLVVKDGDELKLAGITSYFTFPNDVPPEKSCGIKWGMGYYTNVKRYEDWIKRSKDKLSKLSGQHNATDSSSEEGRESGGADDSDIIIESDSIFGEEKTNVSNGEGKERGGGEGESSDGDENRNGDEEDDDSAAVVSTLPFQAVLAYIIALITASC